MDSAKCLPGLAVTVKAADAFFEYIDGWTGTVTDMPGGGGGVWITVANQGPTLLHFLIPPDQLEPHDQTPEN